MPVPTRKVRAMASVLAVLLVSALMTAAPSSASPAAPSATWVGVSVAGGAVVPWPGGVNVAPSASIVVSGTSYATGTASSDRVIAVQLVVRNSDTTRYLEGSGKFGSALHIFRVAVPIASNTRVAVPGGTAWSASWTWTPPGQPWTKAGALTITATSIDKAGDHEVVPTVYQLALGVGTGKRFLTLSFGRTTWGEYTDSTCSTLAGGASLDQDGNPTTGTSLTLDQVADMMAQLNPKLFGTGNVVVNRVLDSGRACVGQIANANWADLAMLKATYHWKFVSAGLVYTQLGTIPEADWTAPIDDDAKGFAPASSMQDEICGSAHALAVHAPGFPEANGLFAYPNDSYTDVLESSFVLPCYAFGRTYRGQIQTRRLQVLDASDAPPLAPLWYSRTVDVTGGACVDELPDQAGLPLGSGVNCTGHPAAPPPGAEIPVCEARTQHTTLRALTYPDIGCLVTMVQTLQPGQWLNLQTYRFVTGAYFGGSAPSWDCRDADWRKHWTNRGELLCWDDYAQILQAIPSSVTIADPAAVAAVMGRTRPPTP